MFILFSPCSFFNIRFCLKFSEPLRKDSFKKLFRKFPRRHSENPMSVLRDFYCCTFALLLKKGERLFFSISFIMTSSILYLILGFQQNNDTNCVCVKRKYRGIRSKKTSKRDHRTANTIQLFIPTKMKFFGYILFQNKSQGRGIP